VREGLDQNTARGCRRAAGRGTRCRGSRVPRRCGFPAELNTHSRVDKRAVSREGAVNVSGREARGIKSLQQKHISVRSSLVRDGLQAARRRGHPRRRAGRHRGGASDKWGRWSSNLPTRRGFTRALGADLPPSLPVLNAGRARRRPADVRNGDEISRLPIGGRSPMRPTSRAVGCQRSPAPSLTHSCPDTHIFPLSPARRATSSSWAPTTSMTSSASLPVPSSSSTRRCVRGERTKRGEEEKGAGARRGTALPSP
jgi:hypothetical protein